MNMFDSAYAYDSGMEGVQHRTTLCGKRKAILRSFLRGKALLQFSCWVPIDGVKVLGCEQDGGMADATHHLISVT